MSFQKEIKTIKYTQDLATETESLQFKISNDILKMKEALKDLENEDFFLSEEEVKEVKEVLKSNQKIIKKESQILSYEEILEKAEDKYKNNLTLNSILSKEDLLKLDNNLKNQIQEFNKKYELDSWDYAIAGSTGLVAAILDIFCVQKPLNPTKKFDEKVNGIFNEFTQNIFNKMIPPELSKKLSKLYTIGAPDASTIKDFIKKPNGSFNPINHRLLALSHDPVLGIIFGVLDILNNTCTIIDNGKISILKTTKNSIGEENVFYLIGKMFMHLLSDVNAPSAKGNRGMGLPAPFMGLLKLFENIKVGDSNFGKQVEFMYTNGYDFRQFVATSIPMIIMEVLMRVMYVVKESSINNRDFFEVLKETQPGNLNPRFRMMLTIGYGTSCSINAGKVYVTQDILNANYSSWMGLTLNSFHSLKWAFYDKHMKFWTEYEEKSILELNKTIEDLEIFEKKIDESFSQI
ncbi:MAG: hypothetical protein ACRDAQ_00525 [Cetobacterium sp.]